MVADIPVGKVDNHANMKFVFTIAKRNTERGCLDSLQHFMIIIIRCIFLASVQTSLLWEIATSPAIKRLL